MSEQAREAFLKDSGYIIDIAKDAAQLVADIEFLEIEHGMSRAEAIEYRGKYSALGFKALRNRHDRFS
ncbi:hypothetical protein RM52_00580 [Microbacterium hominis]|uniref:Uncharacterized protein n=2 Tax=Microbacterium hominis TaxID=162426 RepID=A0A0B4CZX3_9MICO|nr:hypothetical protein RM52_00580 [Microbacterium hominis]